MEKFNVPSILDQFELAESSIKRAKIPFEINTLHSNNIEVTLYELIKTREQITNMIREIDPERFGVRQSTYLHIPQITIDKLGLCDICGSHECGSDHK